MENYLVIFGALVSLFGIFFYIRETIKGKTKPNRITWFMWSVAPFIATAAALSSGVTWAALPVFMSGFSPFLVFLSSFWNPKSYWRLGMFDYLCGLFSILALILWAITQNPTVAIVFAIASDAFAGVPTVVKCWKKPETETWTPFFAGLISAATTFSIINTWSFTEYAFSAYLITLNCILLIAIFRKNFFYSKTRDTKNKL